jgi:hypothetical protein
MAANDKYDNPEARGMQCRTGSDEFHATFMTGWGYDLI